MHSDKQNSIILPSGFLWSSYKEKELKLLTLLLASLAIFDFHVDFMSENNNWKTSYKRIFLPSFHTAGVVKFYHATRKMYNNGFWHSESRNPLIFWLFCI